MPGTPQIGMVTDSTKQDERKDGGVVRNVKKKQQDMRSQHDSTERFVFAGRSLGIWAAMMFLAFVLFETVEYSVN